MNNIVFSTTKQWNPGDEIIMDGIRHLLENVDVKYNSIIFNRNPDIRNEYPCLAMMKADIEDMMTHRIKTAIRDNSIKPWNSYESVSAIVFAGTPEWETERCRELFVKAVEYRIPVYFIGIDSKFSGENALYEQVLNKAKLIIVRNQSIVDSFKNTKANVECRVCPSLFCSKKEKKINQVKTIGLIFRAREDMITAGNGWDEDNYQKQNNLYASIIEKYNDKKIIIICHYIDEIFIAEKIFQDVDIRYSYDYKDYYDIYGECDVVVGSRIHGIGVASSIGIPSLPVKFDKRADTIDLFYPLISKYRKIIADRNVIDGIDYCIENIEFLNKEFINYKRECKADYLSLLNSFSLESVNYDYTYVPLSDSYNKDIRRLLLDKDKMIENEVRQMVVKEVLHAVNVFLSGKKVIIKGGGWHTEQLLKYLDKKTILAISDRKELTISTFKCIKDEEIPNYTFDYILISSKKYEREMIEDVKNYCCRKKIISIYEIINDNYGMLEIDGEIFGYI